jgi:hypothetical protein
MAAAAAGGLLAAGCTTSGMPALDMPALSIGGASEAAVPRTVAFEAINVPPEPVGRRLTAQLNQEATARGIICVSQERPSQYRVEVYLASTQQGPKTTFTWTWDVSTAGHRVARFTGEVPGAPSGHSWAAADDAVVARLARDGMSRLAAFVASTPHDAASPDVASVPGIQAPMAFLPPSRP